MLELKTVAVLPEGCFGTLLWNGRPFAVSLERTFEDGRPIIQNGTYECTESFFNKGGYPTFEIHIEGHSRVLFHKGNFETDSKACVLVGESFAVIEEKLAIAHSGDGFKELMEKARGLKSFFMTVTGR